MRRAIPWKALTCLIALPALLLAGSVRADQPVTGGHSYESCGLITAEYVTVMQLISRGLGPDALKQSLPDISPKAKVRIDSLVRMARNDGLIDSYSRINVEYASCAKKVFEARGLPQQGSREAHFYRCAGENKVAYEVAIAALIGASKEEVAGQLEPQHQSDAESIFTDLESKGSAVMFDNMATRLKRCLGSMD